MIAVSVSKRLAAGLICLTCVALLSCRSQDALRPADFEHTVDARGKAPEIKLTPETEVVYRVLTAELAGQRNQSELALDEYLKAAELSHDSRVAARTVQIALFVKDNDKLLQASRLWRNYDPSNADARRLSVLLEVKAGNMDAAIEQLSALVAMPEVDLDSTLLDLIKLLTTEVKDEQAFNVMNGLVQRFPDIAEIHLAYAAFAGNKNKLDVALREIELALALHPDWGRAHLLQAQVMTQMGNTNAADNVLLKALKADPDNLRLRLFYAQNLAREGNLKGAAVELDRILAKTPYDEDALFTRALLWLEANQLDKARLALAPLVKSTTWKDQACFYMGLVDARQNHMPQALEWFDRVQSGSKLFDARVNAVTALTKLGQSNEARQRLINVRKDYPDESLRLYLLEAELLSNVGDNNAAFTVLTQAMEAHPGKAELMYARALVAERLDRLEVLEADLRAVLEKNPDEPNALNALGFTLADRFPERLNEAKTLIVRANQLKPGEPAILDSMGWVDYRLGNYQEALVYLQRAFAAIVDPEIGAHLGEVLWESGRHKEAKKIWDIVMKKASDHAALKAVRQRYPEAFK